MRQRYIMVDGDKKYWDLKRCLTEYFGGEQLSSRSNLEFLIGLRNKIEHRHLPELLDSVVYGHCQAALMNLEEFLVSDFGSQYGLEESLSLSLQFSRIISPEKKQAFAKLASSADSVLEYINYFQNGLSDQILNDLGYSFRVFLVPKVVNREKSADASVEFVDFSSNDDKQKLNLIIKEKQVPVANHDKMKPSGVVKKVSEAIPFSFKIHHHTKAWQYFNVRPPRKSDLPLYRTNSKYCIYDSSHKDYLYTEAWVKKLTDELSDKLRFLEITGSKPEQKDISKN